MTDLFPSIPFFAFLLVLFVLLLAGGMILFWRESELGNKLVRQQEYFENKLREQEQRFTARIDELSAHNLRLQGQVDILIREGGINLHVSDSARVEMGDATGRDKHVETSSNYNQLKPE